MYRKYDDGSHSSLEGKTDISSVRAYGDGLICAQVAKNTAFVIDAKTIPGGDVKVVVTTPSQHSCPMQVINNNDGTWNIQYLPYEIGDYYIDVFYQSQLVYGCPFKVNVFDVSKVVVSNIQAGTVGQLVRFDVDASDAGAGQLEISIQDGKVPCDATPRGNFRFDASFLPREYGRHSIDVRFNSIPVPGSPFFCEVISLARISVSDSIRKGHVGRPLSFDINVDGASHLPLDLTITGK
ncbi:unnamed protein product [Didymodactylos carnosus]|uniref:Uncharacterized protein n=1 Tax=Didymodactylos carnosus TaxID=1234261 RepID=A0A8S2R659_9BILA|nr:unnamed protein product [Didymodactylos carnosus]CAF4150492.1 unnamed protein product [Didymodactylos carnosus]